MLIFAKDISQRDFKHSAEDQDPEIKIYMEYQRSLFPYTIIRGGLDLAYKEVDDILNYLDNDNQPPTDSSRQEYPSNIPEWYQKRFPWTGCFLKIEDMHNLLVILIQAMDSFRTHERMNTYHLVALYDSVHNIIELYNELLKEYKAIHSKYPLIKQGLKIEHDAAVFNARTKDKGWKFDTELAKSNLRMMEEKREGLTL